MALSAQPTELWTLSARPQITYISLEETTLGFSATVKILGYNLSTVDLILVSANSDMFFDDLSAVDRFSIYNTLSAKYPPISGIRVHNYTKVTDNTITFTLSAPQSMGLIDIILFNRAGYGKSSTDVLHLSTITVN